MVEFERCWVCDKLVSKKENGYLSRLEYHHVFGKDKNVTLSLCVLCHDLLDRFSLDNINVASEYLKVIPELESMPRGVYPMLKLFFLKIIKLINDKENLYAKTSTSQE